MADRLDAAVAQDLKLLQSARKHMHQMGPGTQSTLSNALHLALCFPANMDHAGVDLARQPGAADDLHQVHQKLTSLQVLHRLVIGIMPVQAGEQKSV